MPCLSSSVVSVLNASIRVSNAASQLAVPLITTTFLGSSVNSSPKGSAVWTPAAGGGGVGVGAFSAVGVSAGDLVSAGGGTGTAEGAGLGTADGLAAGEAEGAGDCANAAPLNATMESAATAARKVLIRFIQVFSIRPIWRRHVPSAPARMVTFSNTQGPLSSHDRCVIYPRAL